MQKEKASQEMTTATMLRVLERCKVTIAVTDRFLETRNEFSLRVSFLMATGQEVVASSSFPPDAPDGIIQSLIGELVTKCLEEYFKAADKFREVSKTNA